MRQILPKELKIKFVETLCELEGFSYENSNPFLVKIGDKSYFVFLKNLSSAAYEKYPNNTRVQLPNSTHFSKISLTDIPFVILGYDIDFDVMVSWNPQKVKERLNTKKNVSLYSRESLQANVNENEFKTAFLSNGEKIILFKRPMLISFFDNLPHLFADNIKEKKYLEEEINLITDRLTEITDKDLLDQIEPLLKNNKVLEAAEKCINFYQNQYSGMTLRDWFQIVKQLYQKNNL
jgi:hypothetical protein